MTSPSHHYQSKVRILWLSDMHIHEGYSKLPDFTDFVKQFHAFYQEQFKHDQPIDYILLSGDIAYKADKKEYEVFWNSFIKGIYNFHVDKNIPAPKVLTIPGNHDISWESSEIFGTFLETWPERNNERKNEFIKKNSAAFIDCFKNYVKCFAKRSSDPAWAKLFDLKGEHLETCKEYERHKLYGYLIDRKNKLIFLLLNTAWFSIGSQFGDLLIDQEIKELAKKHETDTKVILKRVLSKMDEINEYGNQIIGRELLKGIIENVLELSKEYTIITCMHHPLNWLNWNEIYNYNEITHQQFTLTKILDNTTLLLTGHEHVPVNTAPVNVDSKNHGYIHLKGGMFLDDSLYKSQSDPILQYCCLSILEHTCTKNSHSIHVKKFSYNRGTGRWDEKVSFQTEKREKYKTIQKGDLPKVSKTLGELPLKNFSEVFDLNKRINAQPILSEMTTTVNNYRIIRAELKDHDRLIILPLNANTILDIFPNEISDPYFLDSIIENQHAKNGHIPAPLKIHFLWSDLFVDENLTAKYYTAERSDYDEIWNEIAKQCNYLFTRFKFRFFSRYEKDSMRPHFYKAKNLVFINEVLPAQYLYSKLISI